MRCGEVAPFSFHTSPLIVPARPPCFSPLPQLALLQCTVSRAAPKRKGSEAKADVNAEVEGAQLGFLDATQASGLRQARGKASFVRDPIEQARGERIEAVRLLWLLGCSWRMVLCYRSTCPQSSPCCPAGCLPQNPKRRRTAAKPAAAAPAPAVRRSSRPRK